MKNPFASRAFPVLSIMAFVALFVLLIFARVVIQSITAPSRVRDALDVNKVLTNSRGLAVSADPLVTITRGKPEVLESDPKYGAENPLVTVVEFGDFECPYCGVVSPRLMNAVNAHPDEVQLVWKDFPITEEHSNAQGAAEAARCAQAQGKFWDFHERLFGDSVDLSRAFYDSVASDLGLDAQKFASCLDTHEYAGLVAANRNHAIEINVDETPIVFVNGAELANLTSDDVILAAVEEALQRVKGE